MNQKMESDLVESGFIDVEGGHSLYWEDWGNPQAKLPIFHMHGGPGSGFSDDSKLMYQPSRHRVIFHEQRGSGRSLPLGETQNNTLSDLIEDIERLRIQLGIEELAVAGGSWGSCLALAYAVTYPERVKKILLWGVMLGRQEEIDFLTEGYAKYLFPEAWERFQKLLPENYRGNGNEVLRFLTEQVQSGDGEAAQKYADEWMRWESCLTSLGYDWQKEAYQIPDSAYNLPAAKVELHYLINQCFLGEKPLLEQISRIQHISCTVIQGRFDLCTPPRTAWELARAYGSNLTLQWVRSGHRRSEPEMTAALRATTNGFLG